MDLTEAKEFVAETPEEAVAKAAQYFGVPEKQLDLRQLPGSFALSGLGKRVVVLAALRDEPAELGPVGRFIDGVLQRMKPAGPLRIQEFNDGDRCVVRVRGEGLPEMLRREPHLADALSHLAGRAAERLVGPEVSARVDLASSDAAERTSGGRQRSPRRDDRSSGRRDGARAARGDRDRGRSDRGGRSDEDHSELEKLARDTATEARSSGKTALLRPMNSKERWVVHNVVTEMEGVTSTSEGEGRTRRVKIIPE